MEIENPRSTTPSRLPPGCRFLPSDNQLLSDYLVPKNSDPGGCSGMIIEEIEFYDLGPTQLPDSVMFWFGRMGSRKHWFCFVKRNRKRKSRVVEGRGRWRRKSKARDVVLGGKVLGTRTAFVFYEMDGLGNTVRTDWVLHEYALADASDEAAFVLCRVFHKHRASNCTSQGAMNPNSGPSALAISHGDVQIDGDSCLIPAGGDTNTTICPIVVPVELNVFISGPAVPDVEPIGLARSPEIIPRAGLGANDLAAHEIISVMEEDFLELNDLINPLSGNFG